MKADAVTAQGLTLRLWDHEGDGPVALFVHGYLDTGRSFDARELWSAVEREHVNYLVIVGDAFARPMLAALDEDGKLTLVPIADLVTVQRAVSPTEISRRDMSRQVVVSANLDHLPLGTAGQLHASDEARTPHRAALRACTQRSAPRAPRAGHAGTPARPRLPGTRLAAF